MKPLHSYMIQYCRSAESEIHIINTSSDRVRPEPTNPTISSSEEAKNFLIPVPFAVLQNNIYDAHWRLSKNRATNKHQQATVRLVARYNIGMAKFMAVLKNNIIILDAYKQYIRLLSCSTNDACIPLYILQREPALE